MCRVCWGKEEEEEEGRIKAIGDRQKRALIVFLLLLSVIEPHSTFLSYFVEEENPFSSRLELEC